MPTPDLAGWFSAAPTGSLSLLMGPPLCGRSTALRGLVDAARVGGAAVLAGAAMAADVQHPLATLQRVLGRWAEASRGSAALRATRGLHGLASLVPELSDDARPADPARLEAELAALLRRLARHGPVLVAVDDLHRADAETCAVLGGALVAVAPSPVRWLGTWCAGDADVPLPAGARVYPIQPRAPDLEAAANRCRERLIPLESSTRRVLGLVMLAPGPVEVDALAAAAGHAVDAAVDALIRREWLEVYDAGSALQVGPLGRGWAHAVRRALGPLERRALHASWLGAPLDAEAELHHTRAAGTAAGPGAVERLAAAGRACLARRAHAEAAELLTAARDIAERRGGATAALHDDVGSASRLIGRLDAARGSWERALAANPEPSLLARLRRSLALLAWDEGDLDGALAHVRAGWESLAGHAGPEVEALIRTELIFLDRRMDLDTLEEGADRLAQVVVTPEGRSELWQVRSSVAGARGDVAAVQMARRAVSEARGVQDVRVHMRAAHSLNMALLAVGRPLEVIERLEDGDPSGTYQVTSKSLALHLLGRTAELEALVQRMDALPAPQLAVELTRGLAAISRGDWASVGAGDPTWTREPRTAAFFHLLTASAAALAGDHGRVVGDLSASGLVQESRILGPLPSDVARLLGVSLARVGRLAEAESLADRLSLRDPYAVEVGALVRAEVAAARGRVGAAKALLDVATGFERRGMVPRAAEARLRAAEVALDSDPERARRALDAAWAGLVAMEHAPWLARARCVFRAVGVGAPATPRRGAIDGPLSARELEVVLHVARGLTNKEVGVALYVSASTVATHLKRVYRRLGVHSRSALTRWAADAGYLG
ncbi:MAG: DNA-binding CsgD family transcriptional regulator/tetratricopeptide (TPR) repeat protein [Myxococcota bacterium]|jgi:DNA-binding CsgD family transcriptional regulator/tetratricopeptide (TPR) repeat protein